MDLGMRFRDRLEPVSDALVHEFERLMASINQAWLAQHTEDDGHGAITAYSLTLRKGTEPEVANGTKTGNLDADGLGPHKLGGPLEIRGVDVFGTAQENPIVLSVITGISGTGAVGSGLLLPAVSGGGDIAWALINSDDNWHTSIGFFDATNNVEVLKLYRESAGVYALNPSEDGIATLKLGDHTDSDFFFDEISGAHFYERNDAGLGYWQDVTFNAGNFTASGAMTWTVAAGDQITFRYTLIGKTLIIALVLVATTVGGVVNNQLLVTLPGGMTAAKDATGSFGFSDNGVDGTGVWLTTPGSSTVNFTLGFSLPNWTASANNTAILATVQIEVQ